MQILSTYKLPSNEMIEFDYLQYSLILYIYDLSLILDTIPIIARKPKYQVNKPRSSYADNPHIQTT